MSNTGVGVLLLLSVSGFLGCATTSPAVETMAPPAAERTAVAGTCNPEADPAWARANALEKHEIYARCHPQQ